MSASHEWEEYHLTPAGWVTGNEKMDFSQEQQRPLPTDRVLTVRRTEHLSSAYSKMDIYWEVVWRGPNANQIAKLTKKFGTRPRHWSDKD